MPHAGYSGTHVLGAWLHTRRGCRGGQCPGGRGVQPQPELGATRRGQQFAQQMQQQNPELIEQLRSQIRSRTPSASNDDQQE